MSSRERAAAGDSWLYAHARTLLESTDEGILSLDLQGRCTFVNASATRMLGYEPEEILGEEIHPLIHHTRPDGSPYPEGDCPVYRAFRIGESCRIEDEVFWRKDGNPFPVECWSRPLFEGGEISGAVMTFLDITERRRAEERLRESNRRTEEILESITDGFYSLDRHWRFTYLNERAVRFASQLAGEEFTHEGLLGRTLWETLPAILGTTLEEEYRRAVREQQTAVFEYPYPGGGPVFEVHAYPSEQGVSIYFRDITERKRAEEELRESEVFARSTLNSLSAHIAILDETGLILATNRAWRGFAASNPPVTIGSVAEGANYLDVCDGASGERSEEAAAFARGIRDVIAGRRESFELEYPCHSPDEKRWFLGRVTRFRATHPPKVVAAHENITKRKLAEEEIGLRARQQEAVADLGRTALVEPDLSILSDEAVDLVARTLEVEYAKIVELLPGGEQLLLRAGVGWKEGLVGNATEDASTGSQAGYTLLSDEPVILEDLSKETRFDRPPLLHEHGVVSGMSVVIRGREGPFGVLGAHTESRRTFTEDDANFLRAVANVLGEAIEWRRAEEGLGEIREAERGRMGRDLHDGPLQDLTYALAEMQLVQSMPEAPDLDRRLEGAIEALKRTGRGVRAAVSDLRLGEETDRPFPESVRSLVELNRTMVPSRPIRLDVADEFPRSPFGEKDPELLRILQEALTNARRHSEARNVSVSLGVDRGEIWAEVEDDGRGFGTGTDSGVGLKSMSERARALGGRLKIESEPGKGTRVRFASTTKRPLGVGTGSDEEIRVFLVEDHASFRHAAASVLERERGFEVVGHAGSLAEAREMLGDGSVVADVAIVDLGLPDGYGGDLIKELRQKNPQTQTLVLSASLDRAEMARAVEHGAAGILHKSVGMEEVVDAVRRLRAGETLLPVEEAVELLRFAGSLKEQDQEARRAVSQLTPREREVLRALAEGLDGPEIARRLGISIPTERNHMASILAKLGVHSRLQALVFALRYGVVHIRGIAGE